MTTEISQKRFDELMSASHPAIVLTVERTVSKEEAADINQAINDHLADLYDADDMRPVWVRFQSVDGCDIHHLLNHMAPSDRSVLDYLILAVEGIGKYTIVTSFDFCRRQWPKKTATKTKLKTPPKVTSNNPANPTVTKKIEFYPPPNPTVLPLSLRFMSCEEAMREAYKLGDIFDRWPFVGFDRSDLRAWSTKLVAEFGERYPYLAQADAALHGKLTEVIECVGSTPHPPIFEFRRFWMSVKRGAVRSWVELADDLLRVMSEGEGEKVSRSDDRTSLTGRRHFVPARKKPALTTGIARGMVADE